jgi:hypothetical protein
MASSRRRIDPVKHRAHLARRHEHLHARVAAYEERLSLTPEEAIDLRRLKAKKLECKDEIARLEH